VIAASLLAPRRDRRTALRRDLPLGGVPAGVVRAPRPGPRDRGGVGAARGRRRAV